MEVPSRLLGRSHPAWVSLLDSESLYHRGTSELLPVLLAQALAEANIQTERAFGVTRSNH